MDLRSVNETGVERVVLACSEHVSNVIGFVAFEQRDSESLSGDMTKMSDAEILQNISKFAMSSGSPAAVFITALPRVMAPKIPGSIFFVFFCQILIMAPAA